MKMKNKIKEVLIEQEERSTKFFILLFYIIYFTYELFYYFGIKKFIHHENAESPLQGFGYWLYIFLVAVIPIIVILFKKKKIGIIKYFVFLYYTNLIFIDEILYYGKTNQSYSSGNIVDIFLVLFSSIFVNKCFFIVIYIGTIVRYALMGLILEDVRVIVPIGLVTIVAIVAYLILLRFINYVKAIKGAYQELRKSERLAAIGQMAAGLVHEIKNPLTSIQGFVKLIQKAQETNNQYTTIVLDELERINNIVENLLLIGKTKSSHYQLNNCIELLNYVIALIKPQALNNNVKIKTEFQTTSQILCEENQIKQVLLNLMKNAIESMPNGGTLTIKVEEGKSDIKIQIIDQGCGISKDHLKKLGTPFFSTKENGTGLGIMMCLKIIEEHNGELLFESEENKGTNVTVKLPKINS
jgi:signal transduction histidine kinase